MTLRARLLAVLLVFAPAAAHADVAVERDTVDINPAPNVKVRAVDIENRLGDVTIEGHDGPGLKLSIIKRAPDEEILERLKVNLIPDPAGDVHISSALLVGQEMRPVAAGQVRIDIHVFAPRHVTARVRAWDGRVMVSGMNAGATLAAHDGDIIVKAVRGFVSTTSMRGHQRLTDVVGTVSLDDTYGQLELDTISGDVLLARTHRGAVVARRIRSRSVNITTTFGDIRFRGEVVSGMRVELRSYKGNIEVAARGAFQVDARSRDGRVDAQVELKQVTRPEIGRLMGVYGSQDQPAALVLSSTVGRVVFGLMHE